METIPTVLRAEIFSHLWLHAPELIDSLPIYLRAKIFTHVWHFVDFYPEGETNYNPRYQIASWKRRISKNISPTTKLLLSRITKPNGNHRYYLTREVYECYCHHVCYGPCTPYFSYTSQYVGKSFEDAVQKFLEN